MSTAPTWFGHPRGMFLVALTEFWERFSYWGLAAVLVLFLTASTDSGGWGWPDARALQLYGAYAGLGFILPVIGAWLANTILSERRGILLGGVIIMCGHLLLAAAMALPAALQTGSFLLGLLLILAGTGLLKPSISSIVARLYPEGDARRDEGFSYFFIAIYIGALLGGLVVGYFGERIGWHYAFGAAAVGMAAGLAGYLAKQRQWLADIGTTLPSRVRAAREPLMHIEWQRVRIIGLQGLFTAAYSVGFYQVLGLLSLYAHTHVDRTIWGVEVPTTWVQTTGVWAFLLFSPLLAWAWRRLETTGRNPSASYKLALGLLSLAVGYLILMSVESVTPQVPPSCGWLIVAYLFFGLGDALVWAPQISLTSKLAPARYAVLLVGGWYVFMGVGTWLAGAVGAWLHGMPFQQIFLGFCVACLLCSLVLAALTPAIKRRMPGVEQ